MNEYNDAVDQLSKLASFANVESNLKDPPISLPQDKVRAAGIHPDVWYGLGIVGVWAALDAFGERKGFRGGHLSKRFQVRVNAQQLTILVELDNLRNLFAHNFAGVADQKYLGDSRRRLLKANKPHTVSCGYTFNGVPGDRIAHTLVHFEYYISQARNILDAFQ